VCHILHWCRSEFGTTNVLTIIFQANRDHNPLGMAVLPWAMSKEDGEHAVKAYPTKPGAGSEWLDIASHAPTINNHNGSTHRQNTPPVCSILGGRA
jgi:hypothetical protein